MMIHEIADALEAAARKAGKQAESLRHGSIEKHGKIGRDYATIGDLQAQKTIIAALESAFPTIPIVAEEQKDPQITSEEFFVIDPIDGTWIYANGFDEWGVTAAYVKNGRPQVGVIYQPVKDDLVKVVRGEGCLINDSLVQSLLQSKDLGEVIINVDINNKTQPEQLERWLIPLAQQSLSCRAISAAIAAVVEVLQGRSGAYINLHGANIWDFAAGALAIEEAGGCVIAPDGAPIKWDQVEMGCWFFANRTLMQQALAATSRKTG